MPTFNQLLKKRKFVNKKKNSRAKALSIDKSPFKRGIVMKVRTKKPKKPNSATRKIAQVKLSNKRTVNCYIPGLGHNLRDYSVVLVRGGGAKDLNGIQYHCIRGLFDFDWRERKEINRQNKLTRRGVPKNEKRDVY